MGLYKRGRLWWVRFSYDGRQIRRSAKTDNKKKAEDFYCLLRREIVEGRWIERLPGERKRFREMMEKYMKEHSIPTKASSERDKSSLTHLLPFFGNYYLKQITPKAINEYKNQRRIEGASPSTINRELALMKHAFNLAIKEWEWINKNPVERVSFEKEPPPRDRWLTREEEEKILSVSPQWLREIIIFALETGCRREEILSLVWREVDFSNHAVTIFGKKTGERRSIPLTKRALEVLMMRKTKRNVVSIKGDFVFTHPPGQKINIHTLRWAFERAVKKAGLEDLRFHDLRHTFASRLAQSGVDPYTIQRLMGHKSFTTTQRYAHHYLGSLKRGIMSLERFTGEEGQNLSLKN